MEPAARHSGEVRVSHGLQWAGGYGVMLTELIQESTLMEAH